MADSKTTQLTQLAATPAVGDQLMIVDVSDTTMAASGTNKRLAASYLARSDAGAKLITGDGKELTVPATGTAALLAAANTFTTTQSINPSTNANAISGAMPADNTSEIIDFYYATEQRFIVRQRSNVSEIRLVPFDNGTAGATHLFLGRNSNGSTPSPGYIIFQRQEGTSDYVYPDASANLRLLAGVEPNNTNVNNGTIIGTQSSHIDYKDVLGEPVDDATALALICDAAAQVARFIYKNGSFGGEEFSGVVLEGEELHRYGMDADPEHLAGKSLNMINAIGDLFLAVRGLAARVAALEAQAE